MYFHVEMTGSSRAPVAGALCFLSSLLLTCSMLSGQAFKPLCQWLHVQKMLRHLALPLKGIVKVNVCRAAGERAILNVK